MPVRRALPVIATCVLTCLPIVTLPLAAAAACLAPEDTQTGIRIDFANGDVTNIRALGADIYEVEEIFDDGNAMFRFHAYLSTYNIRSVPVRSGVEVPEDTLRIDWGTDIADLPRPATDAPTWTGTVTETDSSGFVTLTGTREVRFAEADPIVLGDCSYATVQVGMRSTWEPDAYQQVQIWTYLPEIGISFITLWTNAGGEIVQTTVTAMTPL